MSLILCVYSQNQAVWGHGLCQLQMQACFVFIMSHGDGGSRLQIVNPRSVSSILKTITNNFRNNHLFERVCWETCFLCTLCREELLLFLTCYWLSVAWCPQRVGNAQFWNPFHLCRFSKSILAVFSIVNYWFLASCSAFVERNIRLQITGETVIWWLSCIGVI